MKSPLRILSAVLVFALLSNLALAQQDQTPLPPVIYEGLEFPELPYPSSFVSLAPEGLPEANMHYMEGGNPDADPILFLHGNPTWSYLWRNIMPHLEDQGRVIAPDLMGMGMSDKPEIGYFFREHADYLDAFINALELDNITLVIQDWGSGLGLDYANRNPDRIKAIALFEAILPPVHPLSLDVLTPDTREFLMAMRTPGMGEALIMGQNMFVEGYMAGPGGAYFGLTEEELNAYRAPFPTPESRLPAWRWPNEIAVDGQPADVYERITSFHEYLASTGIPVLYMWGNAEGLHRPETNVWLDEHVDNLTRTWIGLAGHFAQEDQPNAIGAAISVWYQFIK